MVRLKAVWLRYKNTSLSDIYKMSMNVFLLIKASIYDKMNFFFERRLTFYL